VQRTSREETFGKDIHHKACYELAKRSQNDRGDGRFIRVAAMLGLILGTAYVAMSGFGHDSFAIGIGICAVFVVGAMIICGINNS
jgi:hypothetical protein